MKVLVTGAKGQLGSDVLDELKKRGHTPIGVDLEEMDITEFDSVKKTFEETLPEAAIHCAAWTAVDAAEDNEEKCRLVNAAGTANLARMCKSLDIKLIYISTDYVFGGQGEKPWEPYDKREPLSVYGRTKLEGELEVEKLLDKYFIVRISWVFGKNGKNFVKTMLELAKNRNTLNVVNDQVGSPTYTFDLSRLLVDMIESNKFGCYHAANEGYCSWHEFACEIFREAASLGFEGCDNMSVLPVSSDEFPTKAIRPMNSRMSMDKLDEHGFKRLPPWQDALSRYLTEIKSL